MEDLEYEKQKLESVENELDEIQEGEKQILAILPKKYSNNPILLANLMSATATKISNINRMKDKPYFARIDFKAGGKSTKEKLYIGKIGVLDLDGKVVITDWRAPVSSLYYDSNLGQVEYNAPEGKIKGDLSLKRQIVIQNKKIESIFDVDSVSDDELLKPYLGASADSRLKNIVATIQSEQNDIIRKDIEQNLIVQGVAGSGKTTVALHRIAYLMYNNANKYKADQFMVIGPNKFFINYISNVLPDLDASNAVQLTFEEMAEKYIDEKITFEDTTKKLLDILNGKKNIEYIRIKTSMKYKEMLDNFLNTIENRLISVNGLVINNIQVLDREYIKTVYDTILGNSFFQKMDMCAKVIANRIKNDEDIYESLKIKLDDQIDSEKDLENKRKLMKKSLDMLKELRSNGFEKQLRKLMNISNLKIIGLYKEFVENVEKYTDIDVTELKLKTLESLKNKVIENEDIAALMYINLVVFGNEEYTKFKCVVVDESQDFGKFGFYVLRRILSNAVFSIFGDMAQGIYSYRAINNWKEITDDIFKDAEYLTLQKSYRTSIEIMQEANKISDALSLGRATPVIRSSGPVIKTKVEERNSQEYIAKQVEEYLKQGYKSIALIYKDQNNMKSLNSILKSHNIESEIIYKDQEKYNGGVCILTSYLSKGLEFDVVIICDADEEEYSANNPLDMKLLYVAMTRALHKLEIVYSDKLNKYLE